MLEPTYWTAQLSSQPEKITVDAIVRSLYRKRIVSSELHFDTPDKDILDLLAALQPVTDSNSLPH